MDIVGKKIKNTVVNSTDITIDGNLLNFGIYLVKINTAYGQETSKLMKK